MRFSYWSYIMTRRFSILNFLLRSLFPHVFYCEVSGNKGHWLSTLYTNGRDVKNLDLQISKIIFTSSLYENKIT